MASKEYYDLVAQKLALHKENVKRGKELKGLETVRNRAIRPFTSRKVVGRNQNEPAEPKRWGVSNAEQFIKEHENDDVIKAEEKEQAMDQEEDLEDLTDGELEEIEKNIVKIKGVKDKLSKLVQTPDVYPSEVVGDKGKEGIDEYKKRTNPIKQILAETKDSIRQSSRANQDMFKTNKKVPQNNRVIHPSEGRFSDGQQSILNPENFGEVTQKKIKKLKETVEKTSNQQIDRFQKPRKDNTENPMTSTTELPKTHNNLAYGMTDKLNPEDNLKNKPKLAPHRPASGITDDFGTTTKLTPKETKRQSDYLLHLMQTNKPQFYKEIGMKPKEDSPPDKKIDKKPEAKREIPEGIEPWKRKIMEQDPNSKYWKEVNTSASEPTVWENWLEKYVETDKDKLNATKLNENRAVKEGKVRPPTSKHLVQPAWKSWLEKDQGQGDAKYGNPHETGMEDPRVLQTSQDDFSMEEKKDEKDKGNKPYIERNDKTD